MKQHQGNCCAFFISCGYFPECLSNDYLNCIAGRVCSFY